MNDTLHRCAFALLPVIALVMTSATSAHSADTLPGLASNIRTVEPSLEGTWVILSSEDPSTDSSALAGNSVKVFTKDRWSVTWTDPETGEVRFHHGGSYTFDGQELITTVEFANAVNASLVGRTNRFRIELQDDTFRQVGMGNRWTEVWKRLIAREPQGQVPVAALACDSSPEGRSALLMLNREAGRPMAVETELALGTLVKAAEEQPADPTRYIDLGRCYYAQHRRSDSTLALSKALDLIQKLRATQPEGQRQPIAQRELDTVLVNDVGQMPRKLKDVSPLYPDDASRTRVTGVVIVEASLGRDGKVTHVRVIRSIPMLDSAALEAVSQWEYASTVLNGESKEVVMSVDVEFGAPSPVHEIDVARFFVELRRYSEAEDAVSQAINLVRRETQRAMY